MKSWHKKRLIGNVGVVSRKWQVKWVLSTEEIVENIWGEDKQETTWAEGQLVELPRVDWTKETSGELTSSHGGEEID